MTGNPDRFEISVQLNERIKEINVLHQTIRLILDRNGSVIDFLRQFVACLPAGFRNPQMTAARVRLGESLCATSNYRESPWMITSSFCTTSGVTGALDVVSLEFVPDGDESPFLREELELLDTLASILNVYFSRLEMAQSIEESEHRFRSLLENSMDSIAVMDEQLNITYAGPSNFAVLGYTPEEMLALKPADLVHADDRERIGSLFQTILKKPGARFTTEVRCRHKDGSWRWMEGSVANLTHKPYVRGLVANYRDVTERVKTRRQLRESEERYRNLVESARDVIFTIAENGSIETLNEVFDAITGWRRDRWIGKHYTEILHPDDHAIARNIFRNILSGDTPDPFELRVMHADGRVIHVEFTASPLKGDGRWIGILGIGRDVSERKRLEERLHQAQKMESIGQLAAGIAHDFNNILTVQQGYLGMILDRADLDPELQEYVREIAGAREQATQLTGQLLAFSRKQLIQPKPVDLNRIILHMDRMLRRIVRDDIVIETDLMPDPPLILADEGMMAQILMNLLINARDAMPSGGVVRIRTERVDLDPARAREHPESGGGLFVCMTVSDSGTGIADDDLSHIFEPFYSTKQTGKGTGLGLATVYGIVKQHRGWVEVSSAKGAGTTFRIYFPSAGHARQIVEPASGETAITRGGTETILIVEDEDSLRLLIERILRKCGYDVVSASSGAKALAKWDELDGRIDLVFTDMVMPAGLSGRELARELWKRNPRVPVIFASGYASEILRADKEFDIGVNYLPKPYTPEQLARIVRNGLDRTADATSQLKK